MSDKNRTHTQKAEPNADVSLVGDIWVNSDTGEVKFCTQITPTVVWKVPYGAKRTISNVAGSIPAGGTGAAAGGWDTAGNRDTAITTIGEIKTQVNALLAELRLKGIIS